MDSGSESLQEPICATKPYITLKRTGWMPVALIPFVERQTFYVLSLVAETYHELVNIVPRIMLHDDSL